ncbi:hypothetical protein ARUL111621_13385 [Arthrobacter ulcerisalmonis]
MVWPGGFTVSVPKKCVTTAVTASGVRPVVSSTTTRACCQEIVPSSNAPNTTGKDPVNAYASHNSADAARSPIVNTHATSETTHIPTAEDPRPVPFAEGGVSISAASAYAATRRTFAAAVAASTRANTSRPDKHESAKSRNGSPPSTAPASSAAPAVSPDSCGTAASVPVRRSDEEGTVPGTAVPPTAGPVVPPDVAVPDWPVVPVTLLEVEVPAGPGVSLTPPAKDVPMGSETTPESWSTRAAIDATAERISAPPPASTTTPLPIPQL